MKNFRSSPDFVFRTERVGRVAAVLFFEMVILSGGLDAAQPTARVPQAPTAEVSASAREHRSPLGLPRLKPKTSPGKAAKLDATAYEVDALEADSNVAVGHRAGSRGGVPVIEVDPEQEWTRPLRSNKAGAQFVSLLLNASNFTVVSVGGAWIGVAGSPLEGCLQLMVGESEATGIKWREAGLHIPTQKFGGAKLIALPVLTFRLNRSEGVWDLFAGSTPLADNLSLPRNQDRDAAGKLLLRAGDEKSLIVGLVQSDENPLFADANGNGIDDEFEQTKKGGLLPASLEIAGRREATKEWREYNRTHRNPTWLVDRPQAD